MLSDSVTGHRGSFLALYPLVFLLPGLVAAAQASAWVTCGSCFKLQHDRTRGLLHSHEISYGSGSGQQSVTANFESNDANSLWIARPLLSLNCTQGSPVKNGGKIRLQHAVTRKWLHSHNFRSPLSQNQEVSAFGTDTTSDSGDVWIVSWEKGSSSWQQDHKVRFKHEQTGIFLASHDRKYGRPIAGQQEVCGTSKSDVWSATEGIYFPDRADL